jgi:hypothetical protein
MISALAMGAHVLAEPVYLRAAQRAADFLLARLQDSDAGTLYRRYREGEAAVPGFSDDYSFLVQGLLDLHETSRDTQYLDQALRLTERQLELFEDRAAGGLYTTPEGDTALVLRLKDDHDGAEPSANSVAALNLLRLAATTEHVELRSAAEQIFRAFSSQLGAAPSAMPMMLVALGVYLSDSAGSCKDFVCQWQAPKVVGPGELVE